MLGNEAFAINLTKNALSAKIKRKLFIAIHTYYELNLRLSKYLFSFYQTCFNSKKESINGNVSNKNHRSIHLNLQNWMYSYVSEFMP